MTNVIYQLLRDENKTTVLSMVVVFSLFISVSAISANQHCQSDYSDWPVAKATTEEVEPTDTISSDSVSIDVAGTPADLAPYSYGFYSQNYFLESIHARAPAAFSLLS